jgi:acetoin utilization deacetylase AcuC-like enzyme
MPATASSTSARGCDGSSREERRALKGDEHTRLLMIEQRHDRGEHGGAVPWILDERGQRVPGHDDGRRLSQVQAGLMRHDRVNARTADASTREIERALRRLHEPGYLRALQRVSAGSAPMLMAELAEPGLAPDTPVCARAVASAREGIGTAICAARALVAGARFSYALCRPPGHHAGPGWLGGYCYLNNAAAAAQALHDGGFARVAILDLDLHYPNGTAALLERMTATTLHTLHGHTGANLPWERVRPRTDREHHVAFRTAPAPDTYLAALARCARPLARSTDAIVLSLGYDLVEGDPHGSWSFQAPVFERIGRLLAETELPVCVVQEGGYALESLAQCSHAFATGLLNGDAA